MDGALSITGHSMFGDAVSMSSSLTVSGSLTVSAGLTVAGAGLSV